MCQFVHLPSDYTPITRLVAQLMAPLVSNGAPHAHCKSSLHIHRPSRLWLFVCDCASSELNLIRSHTQLLPSYCIAVKIIGGLGSKNKRIANFSRIDSCVRLIFPSYQLPPLHNGYSRTRPTMPLLRRRCICPSGILPAASSPPVLTVASSHLRQSRSSV